MRTLPKNFYQARKHSGAANPGRNRLQPALVCQSDTLPNF